MYRSLREVSKLQFGNFCLGDVMRSMPSGQDSRVSRVAVSQHITEVTYQDARTEVTRSEKNRITIVDRSRSG